MSYSTDQPGDRTEEELAYQEAQMRAGLGDPYAEEASEPEPPGPGTVIVQWTIEVTETYRRTMAFADFTAMFEGSGPSLEQLRSGQVSTYDLDAEQLAGDEVAGNQVSADVTERYVDSFTISEAGDERS